MKFELYRGMNATEVQRWQEEGIPAGKYFTADPEEALRLGKLFHEDPIVVLSVMYNDDAFALTDPSDTIEGLWFTTRNREEMSLLEAEILDELAIQERPKLKKVPEYFLFCPRDY